MASAAAAAAAVAKDDDEAFDTKCVSEDGRREWHVGRLPYNTASSFSSSQQPSMSNTTTTTTEDEPYVFLSHTGQDGVKEEIARPTHWFLTEILKVGAFLDDAEAQPGDDKIVAMATPAYKCTLAVVLLSPTFRQREYSVKELNAFMYRWRLEKERGKENQSKFRVLVALWLCPDLKGYHKDVRDLIWIKHDTRNAAYYMLQTLWPSLLKVLNKPAMSARQLQELFASYVEAQLGGPRPVPPEFCRLVFKDWGLPLLQSDSLVASSSPPSSPHQSKQPVDKMITGVAFSNVYTDDDPTWNEQVRKRKDDIEQCLERMARHGRVTYGLERMRTRRKGFLGLMGATVVRLECEVELHGDLSELHYLQVKKAAMALGEHLRSAGTREADLEQMMIGTAWKGSLYLFLGAPETVLEALFHNFSESTNRRLKLASSSLVVTGMTPAFLVCGEIDEPKPCLGNVGAIAQSSNPSNVKLWETGEASVLCPMSPLAQERLLEGGVPYDQWRSTDDACWCSMATVIKVSIPTYASLSLTRQRPSTFQATASSSRSNSLAVGGSGQSSSPSLTLTPSHSGNPAQAVSASQRQIEQFAVNHPHPAPAFAPLAADSPTIGSNNPVLEAMAQESSFTAGSSSSALPTCSSVKRTKRTSRSDMDTMAPLAEQRPPRLSSQAPMQPKTIPLEGSTLPISRKRHLPDRGAGADDMQQQLPPELLLQQQLVPPRLVAAEIQSGSSNLIPQQQQLVPPQLVVAEIQCGPSNLIPQPPFHDVSTELLHQNMSATGPAESGVAATKVKKQRHARSMASGVANRAAGEAQATETATMVTGDESAALPSASMFALSKPKRPLSAYNFFFKDERLELLQEMEKQPRRRRVAISFEEMGRTIGKRWKQLDPQRKACFHRLAAADKHRYQQQLAVYNENKRRELEAKATPQVAMVTDTKSLSYLETEDESEEKRAGSKGNPK